MYNYSSKELTIIDKQLDPILTRAAEHGVETQQLALDATRLLSCTEGRLDEYKNKGFFKRCWSKLSGKTGSMDRANQNDLIEMQKVSWRYLTILQERNLMLAHSIIAVKNNLLTLAVKEEETRRSIIELADRISLRFSALEERMDRLEVATNIHSWLLTLETFDYDEKYSPYMRLLRVVRDFYQLKNNDWNLYEIKYLQKALKEVGLDWKSKLTIEDFIDGIIDEIEQSSISSFNSLACISVDGKGTGIPSTFILDQIAVPFYSSLARIGKDYVHSMRTIEVLAEELSISPREAHKKTLMNFVKKDGIDTSVAIPLRDLAVELLACMGMVEQLYRQGGEGRLGVTSNKVEEDALPKHLMEVYTLILIDEEEVEAELTVSIANECQTFAEMGYAEAQVILGKYYGEDFLSEATDEGESTKWLHLAAEQGNAVAQRLLGEYYSESGILTIERFCAEPRNKREAVKWYHLAAEQGDLVAQNFLSWCYLYGNGVTTQDEREAIKWLRRAAEGGDLDAQCSLGGYYFEGDIVAKDENEAVKWLHLAAEQGQPEAQRRLAGSYFKGSGVVEDEKEGFKWLHLAAEQEDGAAQFILGCFYLDGHIVAKDENEAVKWLHLAAEQGVAIAQMHLGQCYEKGLGVARNEREAVKWYRLAAEQDDTDAQRLLGSCYERGIGVVKDKREAVKLYRQAADRQLDLADFSIPFVLPGEDLKKEDLESAEAIKAVQVYRLVAEQGYSNGRAERRLGKSYEEGLGVSKDKREAVKWYRLAVELGDAWAPFFLAICYVNGLGVTKDRGEAIKYLRLSTERGCKEAQSLLDRINR